MKITLSSLTSLKVLILLIQEHGISFHSLSHLQFDPLQKEIATHSSMLAWEIPWREEPEGYSPWGRKELRLKGMHLHTQRKA